MPDVGQDRTFQVARDPRTSRPYKDSNQVDLCSQVIRSLRSRGSKVKAEASMDAVQLVRNGQLGRRRVKPMYGRVRIRF